MPMNYIITIYKSFGIKCYKHCKSSFSHKFTFALIRVVSHLYGSIRFGVRLVSNRQLKEPKAPSTRIGFVRFRFGSKVHKNNWSFTHMRFSFGSVTFSASENIILF
jgi:hypothetical protein